MLVVGIKRGRDEKLQDPTILYDQALKKVTHESTVFVTDDMLIHNDEEAGVSSIHAPPP